MVGLGHVATKLAARLLRLDDEQLTSLRGVAGEGLLVVVGDAPLWVDGVLYLGRDGQAPGWLLPTTTSFDLPVSLVCRALKRSGERRDGVLHAVVPRADGALVVPLDEARPIEREQLEAYAQ